MARKSQAAVELLEDDIEQGQALLAKQHQMAALNTEHDNQVRAVAAQLGYQLPADCTDPDLIQRDIAANMRRSVEACLEVGRGLQVLKRHADTVSSLIAWRYWELTVTLLPASCSRPPSSPAWATTRR
ncbi:hypothetical protein P4052_31615 [Pseudomonas aeruginosa]|nr:hypothetical protein [Pseudomonas aeruginosa]MDF5962704.1 hypothetical protein [Pseudomonas aeruginosa]